MVILMTSITGKGWDDQARGMRMSYRFLEKLNTMSVERISIEGLGDLSGLATLPSRK